MNGFDQIHDQVRIGVVARDGPGALKDGLDEPGELHGVGGEDGLGVAPNEGGRVDEVPQPVGVDHQGDVGGLHLRRGESKVGPRRVSHFGGNGISRFTKWSSTREPEQVFELLETLYSAFDAIAQRRNVFKVRNVALRLYV